MFHYDTFTKLFFSTCLLLAFLLSESSASEAITVPGLLQIPPEPALAVSMGAKAVRIPVFGIFLRQKMEQLKTSTGSVYPIISAYQSKKFKIMVSLMSWTKKGESLPLVGSQEREQMFQDFETFLMAEGKSIDWLTLDNEPTIDRTEEDWASGEKGEPQLLLFYQELAKRAMAVKTKNPEVFHFLIGSPALFNLHIQKYLETSDLKSFRRQEAFLSWASRDANIEVIDIHTHVGNLLEFTKAIEEVKKISNKPITISEWSQNSAALAWRQELLPNEFVETWKCPVSTREDFIENCYKNPVSGKQWEDFIKEHPYDSTYMKNSFAIGVKKGVLVMNWALLQYGSKTFDSKQLFASKTAKTESNKAPIENGPFASWYRDLTKAYKDGDFTKF